MSRALRSDVPIQERHAFEYDGDRSCPVAVDFHNPATALEDREDPPEQDNLPPELVQMFRWIFDICAVRADGKLHSPEGMAMRLCSLASLLQLWPIDGRSLKEIGEHCRMTRAAVSKTMLEMTAITGIRSRQQRSPQACWAYSQRAIAVHARAKGKPDAPEETPGSELSLCQSENTQTSFHHES